MMITIFISSFILIVGGAIFVDKKVQQKTSDILIAESIMESTENISFEALSTTANLTITSLDANSKLIYENYRGIDVYNIRSRY